MAKRQARSVELTLDDFDFNDGLDFPDFNFDPPPITNKREAVERILVNARDGFVSNLTSPTFFQGLVRKALPKGFGQMLDLVDKGAVTLRDLYNDGAKEVKPALQDLARTTDRLMPSAEKYLPKKVTDRLKKFVENNQATKKDFQLTNEMSENLAVAGLLADVFKYNAETDAKRNTQQTVQDHLRENIAQDRHRDQLFQLDGIRSSVHQMASYQRRVEFNYHRKSLELQARSYFVMMEQLREQKRFNAYSGAHLEGILKNTALPDFVKMKTTDQMHQLVSNKFINSAINNITSGGSNTVFGRRANFVNNIGDAVRDQGKKTLKSASRGLRDGLAGVEMAMDQTSGSGGPDSYATAGHMFGSWLGDLFRDKVASRVSNRIGSDQNGVGAKVRRAGNSLQYGIENAPQHLSEFANSVTPAEDYAENLVDRINDRFDDRISEKWKRRIKGAAGAIGNPLLDFGRDTIRRSQTVDTQITEGNLNSLTDPAIFTNQTQRSITEVIPGLLSRIHQELAILRTGNASTDMLQFNYDNNRFDGAKGVKGTMFGKLVSKEAKEATERDAERIFELIDPQNKLTPEQRKILSQRMMQDNLSGATGRAGSLARYSNASQFEGSPEERANAQAFAEFFKALKQADADGKMQVDFAQRFSALGQAHGDPLAMIQQYASTGHRTELEEMGLLERGSTKINMEALRAYQSGKKYRARTTRSMSGRQLNQLPSPIPDPNLPDPAPLPPQFDPNLLQGPPLPPQVQQGIDLTSMETRMDKLREIIEQQNTLPMLGQIHDVLKTDITDVLKAMQARLDEGILTVPMADLLQQLQNLGDRDLPPRRGLLRRMVSGVANIGSVTLGGLARGVADVAGSTIRGAAWAGNQLFSGGFRAVRGIGGLVGGAAAGIGGGAYRRARGFVDIYVGNERRPRMYGRMLQEGNVYFDQATGNPIRKFSDITGTVVRRQNGEETVVLEEDEIEHAWQREGAVKKSLKALGAVVKGVKKVGEGVFGAITAGLPLVYRAALAVGKKAFGLLDMPQDVYVKGGGPDPVLLARVMRRGGYRSATTGEVITRPSQIDGPVLVGSGDNEEVALSHDDIRKGLVDKNGNKLRTGLGKLANLVFGGLGTAIKAGKWVGDKLWQGTKGLAKGAVNLTKGVLKTGVKVSGFMLDRIRGRPWFEGADELRYSLQIGQQSHAVLEQIRDILDQRLPARKKKIAGDADGDGDRDGSYEDLRQRGLLGSNRNALTGPNADTTAGAQAAAAGGGLGIMGKMKVMWDKLRGKKDDEEEDDDDGLDIDIDADSDRDRNRPRTSREERRRRRLDRIRNRGVWGKVKNVARGVGKWGMRAGGALLGAGGLSMGAVAGAGGALMSGVGAVAGAVATGAGALVTGLGALVSAPVLLGAAAVAAVGVGAYYGYKYLTKRKLGLVSRIRYTQYGFGPMDTDHVSAVFGLEDQLKGAITYGKDGAAIDEKKVDIFKMLELFGIDKEDRDDIERWAQWFGQRFKPVFLTHVTALRAIAGDKWLSDVDSLDPPTMQKYVESTKFPEGPYGVSVSPFKDLKSLPSTSGDVRALVEVVSVEIASRVKSHKESNSGAGVAVAATTTTAVAAAASTPVAKPRGAEGAGPAGLSPAVMAEAMKVATDSSGVGSASIATVAGSSIVLNGLGTNKLDNVSAVRYRTYGLVKMEADKVKALRSLEKNLETSLTFNKKVASWTGSLEEVLKTSASAFALDITNEDQTKAWLYWFNRRFLPTYLNYASLIYASTGKNDLEVGLSLLSPQQQVDVATALYTSTNSDGSVWTVSDSPWADYELNSDPKSVDGNIQSLKEVSKNTILSEKTSKLPNQPNANASAANSGTAQKTGTVEAVKNWFSDTASKVGSFFGMKSSQPQPGVEGGDRATNAPGATGATGADARTITHPGKGTGGDVNSIPLPKGNGTWEAMKDTILAAAKMAGVDPKMMASMAAIESGFNANAKAGTSTAAGLYQFLNKTWKWMLEKFGSKYGISPQTTQYDPRANALMGAEYMKLGINSLAPALKRPLTDTDIYLSHFLGPGGAKKFLSADANMVGERLMPDEASSNRNIFYNPDRTPRTVGEIYNHVNSLVKNKGKKFGVSIAGEDIVESSTKPSSATTPPPATTPDVEKPKAEVEKTKPAMTAMGVGAATTPTPVRQTATAPTPAPVQSAANPPNDMTGFTAMGNASMRDIAQQAKFQQEIKVAGMAAANKTLEASLGVQQGMLEALGELISLVKTNITRPASSPPKESSAPAATQQAPQRPKAVMRPSPVSMAKPADAY